MAETSERQRASRARSSRHRYREFRKDYQAQRLDAALDAVDRPPESEPAPETPSRDKRWYYVREYLRWLKPHRSAVAAFAALALVAAALELVEPLFMRFIIDRVLLKALTRAEKLRLLNLAGHVLSG